ncbi:MAG: hypothetical protein ACRENB_15680 [Gemmatimonadales bacterium]
MLRNAVGIGFVFFLLAAFFLLRSSRVNGALVLGLALLGLEGFLWFAVRVAQPSFEAMQRIGPMISVIGLVGTIVLAYGAYRLGGGRTTAAAGGAGSSSSYVNPAETAMESLIVPRNATNSFTRAEVLRDQLYQRIERECQKAGLKVIGYQSPARSGAVWLRFDYDFPQDVENLSLRAGLRVSVDRFDYHRFEHQLALEITQGARSRVIVGLIELVDADIQAVNQYLAEGGPFPDLISRRVRIAPWQLWRPRNKVERLRPDWAIVAAWLGVIAVFAIPRIGPLLTMAGAIGLVVYGRRRRTYILTTGKPLHDPRALVRMDSWTANISRLGARHVDVRATLLEKLRATAEAGIQVEPERIWYRGVDGKVEREQLVCTFRRAIAFVHLEPYGDELYVGWDSHVNAATWVEQTLAQGVDRQSAKPVVANRVVPGWQSPNEYDITDVNFLTEWLHAAMVRVLRLKMEEQRIDQEIDFKIQRESRKAALDAKAPEHAPAATAGRFGGRLLRVG